ncbi:hypothetical protein Syun_008121 [Stephania yunnanensis]|uniref:Uncharacterized protein n=1 Tax=Stephania yunnanensis TaxID=152371 RepID=A0AAP0L0S9_9MAGN
MCVQEHAEGVLAHDYEDEGIEHVPKEKFEDAVKDIQQVFDDLYNTATVELGILRERVAVTNVASAVDWQSIGSLTY